MRAWITGAGGLIGNTLVQTAATHAPAWKPRGLTRAMLDLIALAYWTDMTRVSTLMMAHTETRSTYGFLGINDELHMLSHFVRTRNRSSGLSGYDKINHWYVQQFAYFIDKLKSLDDDEGSVFDNSIVLFGSGIKHGDYHSVTDLPLVLSGLSLIHI